MINNKDISDQVELVSHKWYHEAEEAQRQSLAEYPMTPSESFRMDILDVSNIKLPITPTTAKNYNGTKANFMIHDEAGQFPTAGVGIWEQMKNANTFEHKPMNVKDMVKALNGLNASGDPIYTFGVDPYEEPKKVILKRKIKLTFIRNGANK